MRINNAQSLASSTELPKSKFQILTVEDGESDSMVVYDRSIVRAISNFLHNTQEGCTPMGQQNFILRRAEQLRTP